MKTSPTIMQITPVAFAPPPCNRLDEVSGNPLGVKAFNPSPIDKTPSRIPSMIGSPLLSGAVGDLPARRPRVLPPI